MGHFLHDAAIDLFDPGFAVDDDVVEMVSDHGNDFLEVGVYLAVAACALRSADGEEGDVVSDLDQRVEHLIFGFAQEFDRSFGVAVFHRGDEGFPDVVDRRCDIDSQRGRKTDGGVRIDGEDLFVRMMLRQQFDGQRGERCLADTALSDQRENGRRMFIAHKITSLTQNDGSSRDTCVSGQTIISL